MAEERCSPFAQGYAYIGVPRLTRAINHAAHHRNPEWPPYPSKSLLNPFAPLYKRSGVPCFTPQFSPPTGGAGHQVRGDEGPQILDDRPSPEGALFYH